MTLPTCPPPKGNQVLCFQPETGGEYSVTIDGHSESDIEIWQWLPAESGGRWYSKTDYRPVVGELLRRLGLLGSPPAPESVTDEIDALTADEESEIKRHIGLEQTFDIAGRLLAMSPRQARELILGARRRLHAAAFMDQVTDALDDVFQETHPDE